MSKYLKNDLGGFESVDTFRIGYFYCYLTWCVKTVKNPLFKYYHWNISHLFHFYLDKYKPST